MHKEKMEINWAEVFYYDETSPTGIRWNCDIHRVNQGGVIPNSYIKVKGDVAGSIKSSKGKNYHRYQVKYMQVVYNVSRIVYEIAVGKLEDGMTVDHVDGNALNNLVENLRQVPSEINNRNLRRNRQNKSGVNGVRLSTVTDKRYGYIYSYYTATWRSDNRPRCKAFSIDKLGHDEAFRLACEYRTRMIEKLNVQGAGYTETHGLRDSH